MAKDNEEMLAVCGLDCGKCDIRRAQSDPEIMKKLLDWFNRDVPGKVKPEQIKCGGCLGDRSIHWSGDCDILTCAVEGKSIRSCARCGEFACERLVKWASVGPKYGEALARLRSLNSSGK